MVRRVSAIGGDDKILQPMTNLITTYRTLNSASATMFPPFPESTLHKLVAMTSTLPNVDVKSVLRRYFPVHLSTDVSLSERSESVATKFLQENEKNISEFSLESSSKENCITVNFENGVKSSVPVHFPHALSDVVRAVPTKSFSEALNAITLDHCFGRHVLVYVVFEREAREFQYYPSLPTVLRCQKYSNNKQLTLCLKKISHSQYNHSNMDTKLALCARTQVRRARMW